MLLALRNLELAFMALALPVFIGAGWPLAGWIVGSLIWIVWRLIGAYLDGRAAAAQGNLQRLALIQGASSVGRGWILLIGILAAGLIISREVGFAAALLLTVLFTVSISSRFVVFSATRGTDTKPTAS